MKIISPLEVCISVSIILFGLLIIPNSLVTGLLMVVNGVLILAISTIKKDPKMEVKGGKETKNNE